ncbi:putative anthranilate synthase component 1 [Zancudomyces culisetae]|uniref:Putative anthranilate synthase component 1 n=1 Tax=Zancudomyces culisetae TaxID=1213189 RepID=A0A1R1PGX3_ZANCU|nr:putative anthranilate synthase component 1 [Zancudomyces culisetae]|eukprot:OMH80226.1 putative anthranilate synthase component 1 [Zancudomyces culisetae]
MFCDEIVLFDNRYKIVKVYGHLRIPEGYNKDTDESLLEELYNECVGRIYKITATLNSDRIPTPRQDKIQLGGEYKSNTGREGYKSMVQKLKEHIVKGDIYQSVPSQRITRASNLHPFNIYRYLRTVNPSPYMFYYDFEDFQVVGASPELLARVNRRRVDNHPIAGTRKRGSDAEEDEKLAAELISDEKERAEHVMLVDLSRNDLNRVCKPNSMSIDKEMEVEYFSHVMHIVSNVSGELRDDKTCFDAIRSVLPAGTLSGSPKVRAVQLIYECEKEKRGIYGGAVGHFQYNGNMDTCIAIRTMVVKNNMVYLQSGAGVVYDSDPEAEWQETLNKAMSNLYTLSSAEEYYKKLEGQRQ